MKRIMIVVILFLSGCSSSDDSMTKIEISRLKDEIKYLRERLSNISDEHNKIDKLENNINYVMTNSIPTEVAVSTLKMQVSLLDSMRDAYKIMAVNPVEISGGGFTRMDTSLGTFFVKFTKVESYLSGVKVFLSIGNPSSASFNGLTLKLKWGQQPPQLYPSPVVYDKSQKWDEYKKLTDDYDTKAKAMRRASEEWEKNLRAKDFTLTDKLEAGCWNPVCIVLPDTSSSTFSFIRLSMDVNSISLVNRGN